MASMRRDDWVKVALSVLSEQGSGGLTLATVCDAAGRTKGSFYHHFKDMSALREAMLSYWEEAHTLKLISIAQEQPTTKAKAQMLNKLASEVDWGVERAVRRWAHGDDVAMRSVRAVDRRRVTYLAGLYEGVDDKRANDMAWVEYSSLLGAQQVFESFSPKQKKDLGAVLQEALALYAKHHATS